MTARYAYDATADALYITLHPDVPVAFTAEVDDGTNVDVDTEDRPVGVEVLNPRRLWPLAEILRLWVLPDEDTMILIAACPYQVSMAASGRAGGR